MIINNVELFKIINVYLKTIPILLFDLTFFNNVVIAYGCVFWSRVIESDEIDVLAEYYPSLPGLSIKNCVYCCYLARLINYIV